MLKINLFIVILLVAIQHTRQSELNMGDCSNKGCGNPLITFAQLHIKPYEGDPYNAHPIKNILRFRSKKKPTCCKQNCSNKKCEKLLMGLLQRQHEQVKIDPDNAIETELRAGNRKRGTKSNQALLIPMLLMGNEAFSKIQTGTFNFKDIETFEIKQSS